MHGGLGEPCHCLLHHDRSCDVMCIRCITTLSDHHACLRRQDFHCYSEVPQFHRTHKTWLQGHASADSEDSDSSHPQSPDAAHDAGSVSTLILQGCNCADAELDSDACTHSIILPVFCGAWHTCDAHCKCQSSFITTCYVTQLLTIRLMACTHSKTLSHVCTHNITCAFSGRLPGHPSMQAYQFCNNVCYNTVTRPA